MTISRYFKAIMFCLALGLGSRLSAVIESLTHFAGTKDRPEVLLIGLLHHADDKNDSLHKELLLKHHVERWAKENDQSLMLLEASEFTHTRYTKEILPQLKRANPRMYIDMLYDLPIYAEKFKCSALTKSGKTAYQKGKLRFCFADDRGPGVTTLGDFFTTFDDPQTLPLLSMSVGLPATDILTLDAALQSRPQLRKAFFKGQMFDIILSTAKKVTNQISAQDCLAEIDKNLASVQTFRDTFGATSAEYKTMDNFFRTIQQKQEAAKKFFTANLKNLRQPCVDALANALIKLQSFKALFNELYEWIHPLFGAVADAGFVIKTIKNAKNFKKIILFGGNNHAMAVKNALMSGFGYAKPTLAEGLQERTAAYVYTGPRFTVQQLNKHLNTVFVPQQTATVDKVSAGVAGLSLSSSSTTNSGASGHTTGSSSTDSKSKK